MSQQLRPKLVSVFGGLITGGFILGALFVPGEAMGDPKLATPDPLWRLAQAETGPAAGPEAGTQEAVTDEAAAEEPEDKCCKAGDNTPPFKLIAETPPGELNSPYDWKILAEENKDDPQYLAKQFALPGCNACHGNNGAGNVCPSLAQGDWLWGNTDDVLFRLIALGSVEMEKQGFTRYKQGTVKAAMPEMGQVIKTSDQLWRIIAFVRSISPPGSNPPEKVIPGKYQAPPAETPPQ